MTRRNFFRMIFGGAAAAVVGPVVAMFGQKEYEATELSKMVRINASGMAELNADEQYPFRFRYGKEPVEGSLVMLHGANGRMFKCQVFTTKMEVSHDGKTWHKVEFVDPKRRSPDYPLVQTWGGKGA